LQIQFGFQRIDHFGPNTEYFIIWENSNMSTKSNIKKRAQKKAKAYFRKTFLGIRSLSDEQFDKWLNWSIEKITELSYSKLALDKNYVDHRVRDPIPLAGPVCWETPGIENVDIKWKKGKDKIVRFSINHLVILHFTTKSLIVYECDFNFIKNKVLNEESYEFHYQDIVSVATAERIFTEKESFKLLNGKNIKRAQAFRIVVPNDEFGYVITSSEIKKETGGIIPTTAAEQAVMVIRKMLRAKKK
jgi:hypothetical protein